MRTPSETESDKAIVRRIDELLAPWNRTDAPGLVVGVVKDGQLLYRRGFGMASLEFGIANTPATRMRIGSTSKHFTALLALLLAEEGRLDIDAPIRTYIPELTGPGGDPTLRLLMQHRGGSRCYMDLGLLCHGMSLSPPGTALSTQVRQRGRNFAPGDAMIYNNGGYHLLSIAIERVGGAPFERQLQERLFDPLDMRDTTSIPTDYHIMPGTATMHLPLTDGSWRRGLFPVEEIRGEGGIISTVGDMTRWMAHLRARDRFGSSATWDALLAQPEYRDGSLGVYALGLKLQHYRGLPTIHHAGGMIGGSSQMLMLPEHGLDVMILANTAAANSSRLAEQIVEIVLPDALGDPVSTIPSADHQGRLGDFWSSETGMIYSLVDQEGVLKLQLCRYPAAFPLERLAEGHLVCPASNLGEIQLLLHTAKADEIVVVFGGQSAVHQRVSNVEARQAALAKAAVGEYYSADADATATIALENKRLVIRFRDRFGCVKLNLTCLGERVAATESSLSSDAWGGSVLTFDQRDEAMTGFGLNTIRTRNLRFDRLASASSEPK